MNNLMKQELNSVLRQLIGFDDVFSTLRTVPNYPPYDIESVGNDTYRVVIAVAGFTTDDLNIIVDNQNLIVEGTRPISQEENVSIVYNGIAKRPFKLNFPLGKHVEVTKSSLKDGLLTIECQRIVPDELKPKRIMIEHTPV